MSALPQLLSFLSHELRDPLGSLLGTVHQLREASSGNRAANRRHQLDVIEANALRVEEMLETLSVVAQVDAGDTLRLVRKRVPLGSILEAAADRARKLAGKRVALELRCDLRDEIDADVRRLPRALAALAMASMTFARDGATVAWTAHRAADRVQLDVADSGIAVHDEEAPRVNDADFWAGRPRAVGVRLAVRAAVLVVRAHDGTVVRTIDPEPLLRVSLAVAG